MGHPQQRKLTFEQWLDGDDIVDFGHRLMADLPPAQQVARAKAVLDLCRGRLPPIGAVERVATIAADPTRWAEGHDAFSAVRALTLREERKATHAAYKALLFVAEIAAKIIYNASGTPAPFDRDSPWWLANNARTFARALADEVFTRQLWHALRAT